MKRRALLWTFVLLLLCVGLPAWLVQRQIWQERLDTALYIALDRGQPERALELLQQGANPNSQLISTHQPTFWQTLLTKLQMRPEASATQQVRYSPLFLVLIQASFDASEEHSVWQDVIESLLKQGADPNHKGDYNEMPLNMAIYMRNRLAVRLLLKHGADIKRSGGSGYSPLMAAACIDGEMVQLLLEQGADVNAQDASGKTALHAAIYQYRWEVEDNIVTIVKVLRTHRAIVNLPDHKGVTPLKVAQTAGLNKVVKVLKAAGATR